MPAEPAEPQPVKRKRAAKKPKWSKEHPLINARAWLGSSLVFEIDISRLIYNWNTRHDKSKQCLIFASSINFGPPVSYWTNFIITFKNNNAQCYLHFNHRVHLGVRRVFKDEDGDMEDVLIDATVIKWLAAGGAEDELS